jgi:hypothetical protein
MADYPSDGNCSVHAAFIEGAALAYNNPLYEVEGGVNRGYARLANRGNETHLTTGALFAFKSVRNC